MNVELSWTDFEAVRRHWLVEWFVERERRSYDRARAKWEAKQAEIQAREESEQRARLNRVRDPRGSKAGVKRGPYKVKKQSLIR